MVLVLTVNSLGSMEENEGEERKKGVDCSFFNTFCQFVLRIY